MDARSKQQQMDDMWRDHEADGLDWEGDVWRNAFRAYARGDYADADLETLRWLRNDPVADLEETRMDWVPLARFYTDDGWVEILPRMPSGQA